eukprot:502089-Prymnesium_polylepis.1
MGIWAARPTCVQPRSPAVVPRPSSIRCRCASSVMAARATAGNWPTARCLWYRCAVRNLAPCGDAGDVLAVPAHAPNRERAKS